MIYYIDPQHGRDDADGLSPQSAARRVSPAWQRPGNTLLFRRGSFIRGPLPVFSGTPDAWATIGAYGDGPKPVFTKSTDLAKPELWRSVARNIWRCTLPLPLCANLIYDHEAFCGAKRWLKQDLVWPGDWFSEGDELFVFCPDNPGERYRAIEFVPTENFVTFDEDDTYIVIQDVHIKNAGVHGFWVSGGHHIVLRRCDISYIGGAVFPSNFGVPDGLTVRYGNGIEVWSKGHHVLAEGCRVFETYDGAVCLQGLKGDVIHDIAIRGCVLENSSFDSFDWSWGVVAHNVVFENNTCVGAGVGWGIKTEGRPRLSAFLPDGVGWHIFFTHVDEPSSMTIRNNVFYEAPANPMLKFQCGPEALEQITLDHNCYHQPDPRHPFAHFGGKLYRLDEIDAYRAASGFDRHSILADPLFVDAVNRDYRLRPESPCLAVGVAGPSADPLPDMPPTEVPVAPMGAALGPP